MEEFWNRLIDGWAGRARVRTQLGEAGGARSDWERTLYLLPQEASELRREAQAALEALGD